MNEENKPKRGFFSRLFKKAGPAVAAGAIATGSIAAGASDGQVNETPEGTLDNAGSQTVIERTVDDPTIGVVNDQNLPTGVIDDQKIDEPISSEPIVSSNNEPTEVNNAVVDDNKLDSNGTFTGVVDDQKIDEPISSEPISTNQPGIAEPKPPVVTPSENPTTPGIVNDADVNAKQNEVIGNQGVIDDSVLNSIATTPNNSIPGVTNDLAPAPVPESGIIDDEQTKTL